MIYDVVRHPWHAVLAVCVCVCVCICVCVYMCVCVRVWAEMERLKTTCGLIKIDKPFIVKGKLRVRIHTHTYLKHV